jgi:hypothetical protein
MKLTQFAILLFVTSYFSGLQAQEFELGKVSVAELQEKEHPRDTAAVAAILFKKGTVRFDYSQQNGWEMSTVVQTRLKIYKKGGYEWANKDVLYYLGDNLEENVHFSNAVTFNLVNGKAEKTKLRGDGEFKEKINKYWGREKITMPNVKEGSIIEYEYVIKSPRISELREWFFQAGIPVNHSEFITYIPEYFIYTPNQKGFIFPKVNTSGKKRVIDYYYTGKIMPGIGQTMPKRTAQSLDFTEVQTTYLAENLSAVKAENFVNNIENYTASISHELSMTRFANGQIEQYATDWESVAKKIYEDGDFGSELDKTNYFEDDLNFAISGLTTIDEKVLAIFNFVKSKVKWNEYYGYSCNDGVKQAYKDNTGNIAEINLMLTAMLRYANLTANPVLVSTRSNGIAMFPNRTAFNYVIAAVETAKGLVLLDASDKFSTPNVLPLRDLNWIGRLIRKDGTSEGVDLMPQTVSSNVVMMNYSIDSNGVISGKLRKQQSDYNAMLFRDNVNSVEEDAYLEKLENTNSKIEIKDYSRVNEENLTLPVMETYSFTGSNLCEYIGGKIYLSPMLFFTDTKNPFKQESRAYPIDYSFPFSEKYTINVQIPDGYKVEQMPASTVITMEENLGSFKFMSNLVGNTIQLAITHQINAAIISAQYYSMLKEYYQGMILKESEKIVLKKI